MSTPIPSVEFHGSIEQLRALIEWVVGGVRAIWCSGNGERLEVLELERGHTAADIPDDYPEWVRQSMLANIEARIPTRTTWRIEALDRDTGMSQRLAFIEAYEKHDGQVMIVFLDGPAAVGRDVTLVRHPVGEAFVELVETIAVEIGRGDPASRKPRGPTAETVRRADLFRGIKDKHPEYSYARVAREASRDVRVRSAPGEQPISYKPHNVRDAYKAMGWKWERSDKIR